MGNKVMLGLILLMVVAAASATAEPVAPTLVAPPDGFEAIGPRPGALLLVWERVEDATAYEVRVSATTGEFEDFVRFTRRPSIPFGGHRKGSFEWKVRCIYASPEVECASECERAFGPWSETWSFSMVRPATGESIPGGPEAPEILFPEDGAVLVEGNNYKFTWTNVPGCFQYQIALGTPGGLRTHIVRGASWDFRTALRAGRRMLPPEGSYTFKVRAVSRKGPGQWSNEVGFEFQYDGDHTPCWDRGVSSATPPLLLAPDDRAILNPMPDGLVGVFAWTPVPNAKFYEILYNQIEHDPRPMHEGPGPGPGDDDRRTRWQPPTSALVETNTYALVIPDATEGARYNWRVRAIVEEVVDGETKLLPTMFSMPRMFIIGPVVQPEEETDGEFDLIALPDGSEFSGPDAVIPIEIARRIRDQDRLCQITITDASGNIIAQRYTRGNGWDAEIEDVTGTLRCRVREIIVGRDGRIRRVGPSSEERQFTIRPDVSVDGGLPLGDLVNDGSVDSGDAIRALRHSTEQERLRLRVEDVSRGDCNGDGRVDSGDAIYMLRKAVGSDR